MRNAHDKKLRSFLSRLFPYYYDVSNHVVFLRSSLFTEEVIPAGRRIYKSLCFNYLCILSLGLPQNSNKRYRYFHVSLRPGQQPYQISSITPLSASINVYAFRSKLLFSYKTRGDLTT